MKQELKEKLQEDVKRQLFFKIKETQQLFRYDVSYCPAAYLSDIFPSNFHLFRSMKNRFSDQNFISLKDIEICCISRITSRDRGIRPLPKRWGKVVNDDQ